MAVKSNETVLTGDIVLAHFFAEIEALPGIDKQVAGLLVKLYNEARLDKHSILESLKQKRGENE